MTRAGYGLTLILALAAVVVPVQARAALVTDVADAADGDDPLDVNLELRWERVARSGKITREFHDPVQQRTLNLSEMVYSRVTNVLEPRLAIGLFHDLELHGTLPIALADDQEWRWAQVDGASVEPTSSLANETRNAGGDCFNGACSETRPLMSPGKSLRGGLLDPSIGVAWAIFNGERDKKLPETMFPPTVRTATWVVGFDYTMPVVDVVDPTKADASVRQALGLGAHRLTWWTAMSKRLGIVEPYFKIHYTLPITAKGKAYDNCDIAPSVVQDSRDPNFQVMSERGQQSCTEARDGTDPFWKDSTGLQLPHVGGMLVGTEIIPVEESDGLRLSVGVQLAADFVSKGRTYSAVSDQLRKLTYTDQFFRLDGRLALDLRVNQWVHFVTTASIGTETPHFLTSETVGRDRYGETPDDPADGRVSLGTSEVNPNYDFRLDQPGRRLRLTEVSVFGLSAMVAVNF